MEDEAKHNIDKLMDELRFVVGSDKEIPDIIQVLDSIVNVSKTSVGEATEFSVDDVFLVLLRHESKEIIAKTAKAIAEIAKSERGREKCTTVELVMALIDLLMDERVDVLTQTSRALGNICYENENGKKFVEDKDGLKAILAVLEKSVDLGNADGAPLLRNVAAGLLLNFLIDRPSLHKEALAERIVPIIRRVLKLDGTTESEAATHALLILGILNDAGITFLDVDLTAVLVDILASDSSSELSEMCLELLHGQAEDESAKMFLAKAGVCELLLKLLEKHGPYCADEESRSVLKVACNVIVLILTGDESMNILYNGSNGPAYKKLVEWLMCDDKDLQITAVLAMGNFARTDGHCKLMVSQGIHRSLLKLLKQNHGKNADIRFQHALLSALRNLVIPADNKPIILQDGLIDVLYPMLDIPTFPVVFKLLGTLRIVIDGQQKEATILGKKEGLIQRTVEWCDTEDHPGVQGEANRLIAWLINNSRDKELTLAIIKYGGLKHLLKMLQAQHALMQNEAVISLTILSTICLKEAEKILLEMGVGDILYKFLENGAESLEVEIIRNAFTLIDRIVVSEILREHVRKVDLLTVCQKALNARENDEYLQESLRSLKEKLIQ